MYILVYIYICIYIYIYMCIYMCVCVFVCIYTQLLFFAGVARALLLLLGFLYLKIATQMTNIHTYPPVEIYIYMYLYICICIYIYVYTYIYLYIYMHTYICTHIFIHLHIYIYTGAICAGASWAFLYQSGHQNGRFHLGDSDRRSPLRHSCRNSGAWYIWPRRRRQVSVLQCVAVCCSVWYIWPCRRCQVIMNFSVYM